MEEVLNTILTILGIIGIGIAVITAKQSPVKSTDI